MSEFLKPQYPVVKVLVDSYSEDSFGNTIARHRVYGFNGSGEIILEMQCCNERSQTGEYNEWSEYAQVALARCGFSNYKFIHTEGSKSEGALWITYK